MDTLPFYRPQLQALANTRLRVVEMYKMRENQMTARPFPIGTNVRKVSGIDWPGKVKGYFELSTGTLMVNVENRLSPGTAHVYPHHTLMLEDRSNEELLAQVKERLLK